MTRADQDRAAVRRVGLVPIPFDDQRPCLGREADGQCEACTLRVTPSSYAGQFPAVDLIVPAMAVKLYKRPDGTTYTEMVCRNRRTGGTHSPDASVGGESGAVGALAIHGATVADRGQTRKSADCGGAYAPSSTVAGLGA